MAHILKESQKEAIRFAANRRRVLVRMPTGTGKSLVATTLIKVLKDKGVIKSALVILKEKEMAAYKKRDNNPYNLSVLTITSSKEFESFKHQRFGVYDITMISSSLLSKFPEYFLSLAPKIDYLVIDEIHNMRVLTSKTTQVLRQFAWKYHGRMLCLTATPYHTELENVFSIFAILEPSLFKSWDKFFETFVVYHERSIRVAQKVASSAGIHRAAATRIIKERIGYKNQELLMTMIAPYQFYSEESRFKVNFEIVPYTLDKVTGEAYNKAVQGIGLDTLYRIGLKFPDGTEKFVQKTKTESLWTITGGEVSPRDLFKGCWVRFNNHNCTVIFIKESDALGDYLRRLLAVQLVTSASLVKMQTLLSLIPQSGCLIYFQWKESLEHVEEFLNRQLPTRRVVVLTGDTQNFSDKMKSLNKDDIILMTRVATQSLNFYYQTAICYEMLPTPGALEQFIGRITREDATFSEVDIKFLICSGSIESYLYSRTKYMTESIPGAQFKGKLPSIGEFEGLDETKMDIGTLKDLLLWKSI